MLNEVITFDGGINNLIAPHLIQPNQGAYVSNCSIISGQLESAKIPSVKDIPITKVPGLNKPNTDNCYGKHNFYFKAKNQVISSGYDDGTTFVDEDRFYVEWAGFLYWSNHVGDGSGKLQRWDGSNITDLGGQVPPSAAPTTATDGTGLLNGDYNYCFTYVYDGVFESAPSDIATTVTAANNKIKVSGFPTSGLTPAPTHIKIYRSGGLNPTFNLVNEIAFGTAEYIDNTSDFKISRKELTTGTNDGPPADIDMLVESGGTLFGAVGDKVHFSKEGQPEYWSDYNYVQLPTQVTGLGVLGDTVIAFTEENMFAIQGRNVQDVTLTRLPYQYGCKNKRTLQNLKGRLIWLTKMEEKDLIVSFNGGNVEVLNYTNMTVLSATIGSFTYDYFTDQTYNDFEFGEIGAITIGRKYMLFLKGRTVVVDFEFGLKVTYMDETVWGAYELHNNLIVIQDIPVTQPGIPPGKYHPFRYEESNAYQRNISYVTKDYFGSSLNQEKEFRKIHVSGKGKWKIAISVDDKFAFDWDYSKGSTIHLPAGTHGKRISFSIGSEGYVVVRAITYEYQDLGFGYNTVAPPPLIDTHCEKSVGGVDGTQYLVNFKWNKDCIIFKRK